MSGEVLSEEEFLASLGPRRIRVEVKLTKKQKKARKKLLRERARGMSILVSGYMEEDLENGIEDVRYFLQPWLDQKGMKIVWDEEYEPTEAEIEALGGV